MYKIYFGVLILLFSLKLNAQNELQKEIALGDSLFMQGEIKYRFALNHYLKANELSPDDAQINYQIGQCYLYSNDKSQALVYFNKAYQLDPKVSSEIHYMLGRAYHLNAQWDKAIIEYKKYKSTFSKSELYKNIENVNKKIEECKVGKELIKHPVNISIENLGDVVNSPYPEYSPIISADESVLMFTSRRDNTTGGKRDEFSGEYFEDIYISKNVNGNWTAPKNIGKPINTDDHDATVALSPDGQKLLIYKDDKGDGNIYECNLKGDEWLKPHKLDKKVNSFYHESSASFSFDGRTLYFVSNKPGGFGGRDIYLSHWNDPKQEPGKAINLGTTINTKYNESSVFMMPDGRTMYFSSQGHKTMGGYDIFVSTYNDSTQSWSEPENIGYPINTPDDDVFFVMAANGERAYYASFNPDGYGEKDLYVIHFLESKGSRVTILKGIVRDATTLQPLEAKIEVADNVKNEKIADFNSNSKTGKYLLALPTGKNFGIYVECEGYLFYSENINVPDASEYQEIVKDIYLQKIYAEEAIVAHKNPIIDTATVQETITVVEKKDIILPEINPDMQKIILNNVFFDFDKYSLRKESTMELQRLIKFMNDYKKLKVEISGYTDSKGSDEYNQRLSKNRAKAVVNYLIEHGVNKKRLVYKGFGELKPIATNETDEGRQLNRRTEFEIIER